LLNKNLHLGIFEFSRKSFTLFHFTDRSSWLAMALDTLFWRVAGTIVGTDTGFQKLVSPLVDAQTGDLSTSESRPSVRYGSAPNCDASFRDP
jgi:hypothetical protein